MKASKFSKLKNKLVLVKWHDAVVEGAWQKVEEMTGLSTCWTTGWLVRDAEDHIGIAATISSSDSKPGGLDANQYISIPKGWGLEIQEIGEWPLP